MRLLIAYRGGLTNVSGKGKYFHLKEFSNSLQKFGVECKLVNDTDYARGFPSKKLDEWVTGKKKFKSLIGEFPPDAILINRPGHFGSAAIDAKIPLFILLRGNYWLEVEAAKKTLYNSQKMKAVIWFRNRISEKCFRNAAMIFPICRYLENVVKERYPSQNTDVFFEGVNPSHWYNDNGMQLKHPCVGLLQDANIWDKTKEMLVLNSIIPKMPDVNFYWVGDGPYKDRIISELSKFENFKWLGRLQYPENVRKFLSSIDVYALPSGLDTIPLTLKEAQLLEKPVVATNVGGIPEGLQKNQTGFLVEEGDHKEWIDKISILINDKDEAKKMGCKGKEFVEKNFNWDTTAKNFVNVTKSYIKNRN
jgi:glycosyltransferase involved in cell wall biosynthesis